MVRIDVEQMRRRRQQLGWTAEELAERSGLDARTIRRMEHGAPTRLHSAHAVARALAADTSTFLVNDESTVLLIGENTVLVKPSGAEQDDDFHRPNPHTRREGRCQGVMHVVTLLLTSASPWKGKCLPNRRMMACPEL